MKANLIEKSIEKGELQLEFWDKINHYSIVLFSFGFAVFVPLTILFSQVLNQKTVKVYGTLWLSPIFLAVGIVFYFIQKKRLKLTLIQTNLDRNEFDGIIGKIKDEYGWRISTNKPEVIIAKTPFSGNSWGEQITIIFDGNNLLVNSICDLEKRTSVVSCGKNAQNIQLIIKRINRYSRK